MIKSIFSHFPVRTRRSCGNARGGAFDHRLPAVLVGRAGSAMRSRGGRLAISHVCALILGWYGTREGAGQRESTTVGGSVGRYVARGVHGDMSSGTSQRSAILGAFPQDGRWPERESARFLVRSLAEQFELWGASDFKIQAHYAQAMCFEAIHLQEPGGRHGAAMAKEASPARVLALRDQKIQPVPDTDRQDSSRNIQDAEHDRLIK